MLTRRRFVEYSALSTAMLAYRPLLWGQQAPAQRPLRLAILGSVYRHQSNMQTLADRFLVGYPYDGEWHTPNVQVVSVYVDQLERQADAAPSPYQLAMTGAKVAPASAAKGIAGGLGRERSVKTQPAPEKPEPSEKPEPTADLSRVRAQQFGFRLCSNIPEALRCGGDRIAVDAVLAIVEQDDYPINDRGQILLPSYDFFQQCAQVFEDEKRGVPYFNHKQLSYSFEQAQAMVKTANRLGFPLLAGSSLPVTWRLPDVDIPLGAQVEEAVMVGVGAPDGMDFDALEALQCMLERRKGGDGFDRIHD
jgi:hypothetical protein